MVALAAFLLAHEVVHRQPNLLPRRNHAHVRPNKAARSAMVVVLPRFRSITAVKEYLRAVVEREEREKSLLCGPGSGQSWSGSSTAASRLPKKNNKKNIVRTYVRTRSLIEATGRASFADWWESKAGSEKEHRSQPKLSVGSVC